MSMYTKLILKYEYDAFCVQVTLALSMFSSLSSSSSSSSTNFAFDFRLTYKFLRKEDSFVRYGPQSRPYFRGQLLPVRT